MERYTWNPADYAKHSHAQYLWAGEVIAKLDLKGTGSVLDIGWGDGKVTALLASHLLSGEVIGIDSAPGMVNSARGSFSQ
ncbi:MAG: trans-aconitate 2-methyltransferase [Methanoregulaceae archaeon PtaU1.Bin059]|nr:MAG: trans-aconitate 2-methyltransferase [Methanoregulaceae archaeon PtaU1.Bin059]